MINKFEIISDLLAKLMLPKNGNVPYWCSSLIEKVLIFRKGELIEVDESKEDRVKISFKKYMYVTKDEFEKYFKDGIKIANSDKEGVVSDITDLG